MADEVWVDVAEGIATIRFERPPMNALSIRIQEGLREAAREVSVRLSYSTGWASAGFEIAHGSLTV